MQESQRENVKENKQIVRIKLECIHSKIKIEMFPIATKILPANFSVGES